MKFLTPIDGTVTSLNMQAFWEGVKANRIAVKVGDRALVEMGGRAFPALCTDIAAGSNSTWQVSFDQPHRIAASTASSWSTSEMFTWLNGDEVLGSMPQYMQDCIKAQTKSGAESKLWLLSAEEIWGAASLPSYVVRDESAHQFEYYKQLVGENASSPTSANSKLASNKATWLRSGHSSSSHGWCSLSASGGLYSSNVYGTSGVVF